MNKTLKFGKEKIEFDLPEGADELTITDPEFAINKDKFVKEFTNSLPDSATSYSNVGIVVSDKTRLCGYPLYLPWVLEVLEAKGATKDTINIFIAYGTHPKQSDEESLNTYGESFNAYNFVHHDCYDEEALTQLGTTKRGTPVIVRKDVINSSLLITFGAISHHYFAGYGGGRKLLFPGLADRKSVYKNHSLFLDRETKALALGCQPGNLQGNPLAEDLQDVDTFMPLKISIHGILNSKGEVADLLVGNSYADFERACKMHDSYYRLGIKKQYDLVIASSGGYPKDINFIQGHKSIHHAAAFVKDGGKLIVLCECVDGIASKFFLKYLEAGSFAAAYKILEQNYEGNGGTALSMMTKTNRIHIHMMTLLDKATCSTLNVTKLDKAQVQGLLDEEKGEVAMIGNASLLVK